jgi:hypothetical protein
MRLMAERFLTDDMAPETRDVERLTGLTQRVAGRRTSTGSELSLDRQPGGRVQSVEGDHSRYCEGRGSPRGDRLASRALRLPSGRGLLRRSSQPSDLGSHNGNP